jgi:hypothetical protein
MKNAKLLCWLALALMTTLATAQTNQSYQTILLTNGDTLSTPRIQKSRTQTNQNQIVYLDQQNQKHTLKAEQVIAYFNNNQSFYSEKLKGTDTHRFINWQVSGYAGFGVSYQPNEKENYNLKINEEVTSFEKSENNPEAFLRASLPDYDQFHRSYSKQVAYDFKNLAELVSAYNAYKFPDKYVFVKYKSKERLSFALIASSGISMTKVSGYLSDQLTGGSFGVGAELISRYSGKTALHIPMYYNRIFSSTSGNFLESSAIHFEPYLSFRIFPNLSVPLEIGPGFGVAYGWNAYLGFPNASGYDKGKVMLNKLSYGPNLQLTGKLNRSIAVQLMYSIYFAHSLPVNQVQIDDSSVKATINNFCLRLAYCF